MALNTNGLSLDERIIQITETIFAKNHPEAARKLIREIQDEALLHGISSQISLTSEEIDALLK